MYSDRECSSGYNIYTKRKLFFLYHVTFYLIRFRAVGVTDAVGEEEVRDSCDEGEVIDIKGEAELPSGTLMSRFSSSLLRRDTRKKEKNNFTQTVHKRKQL